MSYAFDVNVLYATHQASPLHRRAADFVDGCAARMAYLRIATHPRILGTPLSPQEAMRNVESLVTLSPRAVAWRAGGLLGDLSPATQGLTVRGNLVPDAHVAALLLQHGVRTFYTRDADFRRFAFLDVRDPFA